MNRLYSGTLLCSLCLCLPAFGAEPLVAKIKLEHNGNGYTSQSLTLDGSGSTAGDGVAYEWTVTGGNAAAVKIEDAQKVIAHATSAKYGNYKFILTVSRGAERQQAVSGMRIFLAPDTPYPDYDGAAKIVYKTAPDSLGGLHKLPLYVMNPAKWKASDKRSAILLFHGGGWNGGEADRYLAECRYFASRGMVAITGEYRVGQREGASPSECVADAKSAVRYMRAHAGVLGIDPQKIAVGGESAGAHIAACTGTVPEYNDPGDDLSINCVPNALLLFFPYQMVTTRGNRKDDMSPLHFVGAATPPTMFIAGEEDRIAPAEHGIEWGEKMKAANLPFRFFIYKKTHHPSGKHDFMKPGVDNDMVRQTDLFLASLGFLEGEPTVPPLDKNWPAERLYVAPKDFHPPADLDPKNPK